MSGFQNYQKYLPKNWLKLISLLALLIIFAVPANAQDIVARVNGEEISRDFYDKALKAALLQIEGEDGLSLEAKDIVGLSKRLVDQIVDVVLIAQGASAEGLTVTEDEIKEKIKEVKEKFPESKEFHKSLALQGLTVDDLMWDLRAQIFREKLIDYFSKRFPVSDEEIKNFYDRNEAVFVQPKKLRLSQILLSTSMEAYDIREKIMEGESFSELARKYSKDWGSREMGGDLGYISRGDLVKEAEEVAFKLKKLEVSPVVKSALGYHIIKLVQIIEGKTSAYQEVKAEIRKFLQKEKGRAKFEQWLKDLRDDSALELFILE